MTWRRARPGFAAAGHRRRRARFPGSGASSAADAAAVRPLAPPLGLDARPEAISPAEAALDVAGSPRRAARPRHRHGRRRLCRRRARLPDAEVVGVDLSAGMIAEARRKVPAASSRARPFEQADASGCRTRPALRPGHARQHDPVLRRAGPSDRSGRSGSSRSRRPGDADHVPRSGSSGARARGFSEFVDFEAGRRRRCLPARGEAEFRMCIKGPFAARRPGPDAFFRGVGTLATSAR